MARSFGLRFLFDAIRTSSIIILITLLLIELVARLFFSDMLFLLSTEDQFWQYDANTGWSRRPNSSGIFSKGYFEGVVHNDEHGNRKNSREGTYIPQYRNIFFIGDSTMASLEVNDDETVPALVERKLRAQGKNVNVINLGVRGYGTDQAVRRALQFAEQFKPTDVLYMYLPFNDLDENMSLRKHGRKYGKGVYIRKRVGDAFTPYNYPVPQYLDSYLGLVVLNEQCDPVVIERELPFSVLRSPPSKLELYSYAVRAFKKLHQLITERWSAHAQSIVTVSNSGDNLVYSVKKQRREGQPNITAEDKLLLQHGLQLHPLDFIDAANNSLNVRNNSLDRCKEYFSAQLRSLFSMLRIIPSVEKVHIVDFATPISLKPSVLRKNNADRAALMQLQQEGVIDSLLFLISLDPPTAQDPEKTFRCPNDPHFCARGNAWIADQIISRIAF